jgi:hypothetical protein
MRRNSLSSASSSSRATNLPPHTARRGGGRGVKIVKASMGGGGGSGEGEGRRSRSTQDEEDSGKGSETSGSDVDNNGDDGLSSGAEDSDEEVADLSMLEDLAAGGSFDTSTMR